MSVHCTCPKFSAATQTKEHRLVQIVRWLFYVVQIGQNPPTCWLFTPFTTESSASHSPRHGDTHGHARVRDEDDDNQDEGLSTDDLLSIVRSNFFLPRQQPL
jgi:hypothetical protein